MLGNSRQNSSNHSLLQKSLLSTKADSKLFAVIQRFKLAVFLEKCPNGIKKCIDLSLCRIVVEGYTNTAQTS